MRLATFSLAEAPRHWRPALVLEDDLLLDLEAALGPAALERVHASAGRDGDYAAWWVTDAGLSAVEVVMGKPDAGPVVQPSDGHVRLGPPVPRPGKMLAVGRNYLSHVAEGQRVWAARGKAVDRPPFPSGFAKFASALVGPGEPLVLPPGVDSVDYEIELAVVIGRRACNVAVEDALDFVAGYAVANDVSAREIQLEEMEQLGILLSKNFPTFGPMGPWLVTSDEIGSPDDLSLELRVNGELRQRASTSEMLFSVAEVIASWSRIGLEPGDVLLTGTPGGVALAMPDPAYLGSGDRIEATIERIGRLTTPVMASTALPA